MKLVVFFCFLIFGFLFSVNCETAKVEQKPVRTKTAIVEEKSETPKTQEEKAIRLAEEFIARNGYTDAPADKDNLSHETVEFYDDIDELLKRRRETLEAKAYSVLPHGRGGQKGWTVVFRYSQKFRDNFKAKDNPASNREKTGRAVTMNENFQNLLVEHKDFLLDKIEKKL